MHLSFSSPHSRSSPVSSPEQLIWVRDDETGDGATIPCRRGGRAVPAGPAGRDTRRILRCLSVPDSQPALIGPSAQCISCHSCQCGAHPFAPCLTASLAAEARAEHASLRHWKLRHASLGGSRGNLFSFEPSVSVLPPRCLRLMPAALGPRKSSSPGAIK